MDSEVMGPLQEPDLHMLVALAHAPVAKETVLVEPFGTSFAVDIQDIDAANDGCGPHPTTHMTTGRKKDGTFDDESF